MVHHDKGKSHLEQQNKSHMEQYSGIYTSNSMFPLPTNVSSLPVCLCAHSKRQHGCVNYGVPLGSLPCTCSHRMCSDQVSRQFKSGLINEQSLSSIVRGGSWPVCSLWDTPKLPTEAVEGGIHAKTAPDVCVCVRRYTLVYAGVHLCVCTCTYTHTDVPVCKSADVRAQMCVRVCG